MQDKVTLKILTVIHGQHSIFTKKLSEKTQPRPFNFLFFVSKIMILILDIALQILFMK